MGREDVAGDDHRGHTSWWNHINMDTHKQKSREVLIEVEELNKEFDDPIDSNFLSNNFSDNSNDTSHHHANDDVDRASQFVRRKCKFIL